MPECDTLFELGTRTEIAHYCVERLHTTLAKAVLKHFLVEVASLVYLAICTR